MGMRGKDGRDGGEVCCPRVKPHYSRAGGLRLWQAAVHSSEGAAVPCGDGRTDTPSPVECRTRKAPELSSRRRGHGG